MSDTQARPRVSFQTKVLVPVLALLALATLATVGIVTRQVSRQMRDESQQTLVTAEAVFKKSLEIRARNLLLRYRNAVNEPRFKAVAQLGDAKTMTAYLGDLLEELGEENEFILFTTPDGKLLAGARRGTPTSQDAFDGALRALTDAALEGEAGIGSVALGGHAYQAVAVPVQVREDGQLLGVLTAGARIGDQAVQELKSLTRTEIMLLADGDVASSTLSWPGLKEALGTLWDTKAERLIAPVEFHHEHYLGMAVRYESGGHDEHTFNYLLLSSYEQRQRALDDMRTTLFGIGLLAVLLGGVVVWAVIRRLTRPLREVRDGAEAVGRGDFSRRIERFSNDECGDLAVAFNRMTANLKTSREELEATVATLKNTQAQLVQSEKLSAVGQFVAGVAHELNNPLTSVIGFADLLHQTEDNPKTKRHLDVIAKSAARCHKIVQSLLGFARQHAPERKLVSVNAAIEDVVEIMAYELRNGGIEVARELGAGLPPVLGDVHQLQQVLVNLVGNARQALQEFRTDGRIVIRTTTVDGRVRIEIEDNGPGIKPENLARIFDPFFTTKAVGKGTGLGLSLSYGIVQEHGGRMTVQSEVGRGALFRVELPPAAEGAVVIDSAPGAGGGVVAAPTGKRVLVIDDEEWILMLAQSLLERDGHNVSTARGGQMGLELLGRENFDLIVTDWKMPGLNGIQLHEYLRHQDPAMTRRMLFMTGDVMSENFKQFLEREGCDCLPKPFSIEEFRAAVAKLAAR